MSVPAEHVIEYREWNEDEPLTPTQFEQQLTYDMGQFYDDFYGFVMYAFPWDEKETDLEDQDGPDVWQKAQMDRVSAKIKRDPEGTIREAIASGHGIGKSAEVAWIILWMMSTRPNLNGVVTANTSNQLTLRKTFFNRNILTF